MLEAYAPDVPAIRDGDLRTIGAPIDFLNDTRTVICAGIGGEPHEVRVVGAEYTNMGWEVYAEGIRETLERVHEDYGPPAIYITEKGATFTDVRGHDGHAERELLRLPGPDRPSPRGRSAQARAARTAG